MEDLGHTPVLKSNDLQSLTDTLKMKLSEIEFENRFSSLFHEDLPVPLPKTVSSFVYYTKKKRSRKRKAPAPPIPKEPEGILNYQLQTLQELGPILAKSVNLPSNMNCKVKVKVKSKSIQKSPQHTTLTGYSSLVSVFKIRQTSSLKIRKKTFRKAIRKKNMSLGDLFSGADSTKPPGGNPSTFCDGACEPSCAICIIKEGDSERPSANCAEEEGECPEDSSVLQPLPENSCISPLVIPLAELGILSGLSKQRSPMQENDKSVVEDSPSRNFMISNSTGLQASSPCKQNSPQFNHSCEQGIQTCVQSSPSDMQKCSSFVLDRPSHIKGSPSSGEGNPTYAHSSPSSVHGSAHCIRSIHSSVCCSPSSVHGSPSWVHSSPPVHDRLSHVHGSPSCQLGSSSCQLGSPSCQLGSPSHEQGSPCRAHSSLCRAHSSPCRAHGSPCRAHGSPRREHSSPRREHSSPHREHSSPRRAHSSPRRAHSSPSRAHSSQSRAHNRPSRTHNRPSRTHNRPSRAHGNPAQGHGSSSSVHKSPLHVHSSPSRLCSTPSNAQGSPSHVHSGPSSTHGSPFQVHESPSQVLGTPSCTQKSPSYFRGNNSRMCGYPSWLQDSLLEQSVPKQISLNEVLSSPSKDSGKGFAVKPNDSSFINDSLNKLEKDMEKPCYPSYYKKKVSCDHIYEEVDESYLNLSGLYTSPYPPPVPSNSPCNSPKTPRHSGYVSDNKLHSVKKMEPRKPPRNRNKELMLQSGSLPSEKCSRVEEDVCSRRENMNEFDLNKKTETGSENTVDNKSEIPSDKDEQEKINETKTLKTYYFGDKKFTPEHSSTRKLLPRQSKRSTNSPVSGPRSPLSGPRSPGSPSFRAKKQKNKNSRRKFSIPKTFRFSLKTSFGNIRLSGKKFLSKATRREPHEEALNAYKSWQRTKSPATRSPNNIRIPRIVIHVETPEAENSYSSPEIKEPLEDLNEQPVENTLNQTSPPSPVPSGLSLLNNYEGCDLSVMGSPCDFYTPQSYLDYEEPEECSEVEFIGATTKKSSSRNTCLPSDIENDDIICIETVNTQSKNRQPGLAHSQPDLASLRYGDEEEVIFLGTSKSSRQHTDHRRTSIEDSRLLKENPMYFHSYDDLQILLNSN